MPASKLREFLDSQNVNYDIIPHGKAYTAQRTAAMAHVSGKNVAKTVILNVDGILIMAVAEAPDLINVSRVKEALGAKSTELAKEFEFEKIFTDCDLGAMPPFGNLYNMEVLVDSKLTKQSEIAFNACNHKEMIKMLYADFERLVQPKVIPLTGR